MLSVEIRLLSLVKLDILNHLPIAIIGRGPHSEYSLVEVPLVPLHDELVGATNHVNVVGHVELSHYVRSEQVACAARGHAPALCVCVGRVKIINSISYLLLLSSTSCIWQTNNFYVILFHNQTKQWRVLVEPFAEQWNTLG